jgi:itaconate CoA-transferase
MGYPLYATMHTGIAPPRAGLGHAAIVPYDAYPTAEGGQLMIGVQSDRGWATLARELLGQPELAQDPRFSTNELRAAHRQEVDALVAGATRTLPVAKLRQLLDAAGIPNAALNEVAQVVTHPQLEARDRWRDVQTPGGTMRAVLPPITLDGPQARMGPVPALGAHTEALLVELGYTTTRIEELRAEGAVGI